MIYNLTPHSITIYDQTQFLGFESVGPNNFADGVVGNPIARFEPSGSCRVSKSSQRVDPQFGVPMYQGVYGDIEISFKNGVEVTGEDLLIVSAIVKSAADTSEHHLSVQMVTPHKLVRDRATDQILGCLGLCY